MLFLRALLSFLILPTVFGGVIPWLVYTGSVHSAGYAIGWPVLAVGLFVLLWCVRDFYVIGKGTLAPWDPPKNLVVVGLYRFVRNPMYVGLMTWVAGWSIVTGSRSLAVYVVALAAVFHVRVISYEEPTLARLFGEEWEMYRVGVNRWIPKWRR